MSVSLIDGHIDPDTNCMSLVEKIVIERNREIDNAILGTIVNIANENGISITLNEKAIVDALLKQIPKKPTGKEYVPNGKLFMVIVLFATHLRIIARLIAINVDRL